MEIEPWEKIIDQSKNEFENITDKGLLQYSALNQRDKIKIEMNRRLRISIERFNKQSSEQSSGIFWLTVAMFLVGFAQTLFLIYSIFK